MIIAHLGIAVFVLGATVTTQLGIEKDIKMNVGESQNIAGYDFVFNGVSPHTKDNYSGFIGDISVSCDPVLKAWTDTTEQATHRGLVIQC